MSLRNSILILLSALGAASVVRAVEAPVKSAPWVSEGDASVLPGANLRSLVAARRAVELGFPSVAAELYTQLLGPVPAEGAEHDVLVLELVTARLDEGRTDLAERALDLYKGDPTAAYRLRAGLIAMRRKQVDATKAELAAIQVGELPRAERGWWHFLQGQVAD